MPEVYRVFCTKCLHSPSFGIGGVAAYVKADDRDQGAVTPASYLAFRRDDGELVCLPHPNENSVLREHGGSWSSASRNGQILSVAYKVCTTCGTVNEESQIYDAGLGCMVAIIAAIATFAVVRFIFGIHVLPAFALAYGVMFIPLGLASFIHRIRWSRTNTQMALAQCSACGGGDFCDLPLATRGPMMCPNCRTRNMLYSDAGFS